MSASAFHLASFNACNFGSWRSDSVRRRFADLIANDLSAPHVIGLQEIGGLSQAPCQAVPASVMDEICQLLNTHYQLAYQYYDHAPFPEKTGGEKGYNIRCGFLVRSDIHVLSATALCEHESCYVGDLEQGFSPSRLPFKIEIHHAGHKVVVVCVHLKSMRAFPESLQRVFKAQRHIQATTLIQALQNDLNDPDTTVFIVGDMNDVPASQTLALLQNNYFKHALSSGAAKTHYTCLYRGKPLIFDYILCPHALVVNQYKVLPLLADAKESVHTFISDHNPILGIFDWLPTR